MTSGAQPHQHLVLLGAGHAHLHLLSTLAAQPLREVQVTLIAPGPRQLYAGMLPGFVAGHYALEDCVIALEPLLGNTGVRWLSQRAAALDASTRSVTLNDGSTLSYDWLSVNIGLVQDRQQIEQAMPGAHEHGLFVRPMEAFAALWPRVVALATSRALRVAVIGDCAFSVELAMAIRHRLPGSSVTLIGGGTAVAANYTAAVQQRVLKALKRRNITVLADLAVGMDESQVFLASGARLACDVPVLASAAQVPPWLGDSGLALIEPGLIAVDACQRSSSHANVFAAGEVSTQMNRPLARNAVYAVRAGPALANNLVAAVAGSEPSPRTPPKNSLNLLSCGERQAIAGWGKHAVQGRWVWWLKNWVDKAFIKRHRRG